jgi:hypothetical protein
VNSLYLFVYTFLSLLPIQILTKLRNSFSSSSNLLPSTSQKGNTESLLEDYNTSVTTDAKDDIDELTTRESKPTLTRTRKILICLCHSVIVSFITDYLLGFVFYNESHATDILMSTAVRAYADFLEAYENFRYPQSKEEVVEVMTEFYELLSEMGYYDLDIIERALHQRTINHTIALELNYSANALEIMDMLPYLNLRDKGEGAWTHDSNVFILYGEFADLRDEETLVQCRDPMFTASYDDQGWLVEGEDYGYMSPDHICLMMIGNNGSMIVVGCENPYVISSPNT